MTGFFNPQGFLTAMKQEVTRANAKNKWSLDDVTYDTTVMSEFTKVEQVRSGPKEGNGVYVHGLFIDGAGWDTKEGSLVESEPKKLFAPLPVLWVTAMTKGDVKAKRDAMGVLGPNDIPCYKYPARTDRYIIFMVNLPTKVKRPSHWVLRGVALLCVTTD